jgi:hypothetical protein
MKKTFFIINDIIWISLSIFVCLGGLKYGIGTLKQPLAGFMPFIMGLVLGILSFADLIFVLLGQSAADIRKENVWAQTKWSKPVITIVALFVYASLLSTLGFIIGTTLLLILLSRLMEPRSWWITFIVSVVTTGFLYLGFGVGLKIQLPYGFLGF